MSGGGNPPPSPDSTVRDAAEDLAKRIHKAQDELLAFVRMLPPILKDHQLANLATSLEERLWQVDALTQEADKMIRDHLRLWVSSLFPKGPV